MRKKEAVILIIKELSSDLFTLGKKCVFNHVSLSIPFPLESNIPNKALIDKGSNHLVIQLKEGSTSRK